jgi:hypothetical protein
MTQFLDIPITDYHYGTYQRHLHSTGLKELAKSPAHLKAYWESEHSPTPQQRVGILYHAFALGEAPQVGSYKDAEIETARAMVSVLGRHQLASSLIGGGVREKSVAFQDPDYGFDCIIRPDVWHAPLKIVVDLKSTSDASPQAFRRAISFFKYHWQAWFYLRGVPEAERFMIVAQESKPPYGIMVYQLSQYWLDRAYEEVMPVLELYAKCLASGDWPQYPEEILTI